MAAAINGVADAAQTLIAKGADVEATESNGETALVYAAANGQLDMVNVLLKAGAKNGMEIGFLIAASKCHDAVVDRLLKQGVNVNVTDAGGLTSTLAAGMGGCAQTMRYLISKGASVDTANAEGTSPLLAASFSGSAETMQTILEHSSKVNLPDSRGRTPLMGASVRGLLDIVKILVEKGADVKALDKEGRSAAGYAALAGEQEVVKYFQSLGK
jgi:hypothetical protein